MCVYDVFIRSVLSVLGVVPLEEETFTTVQSPRAVTNANVNADPTLINALRTRCRYFLTMPYESSSLSFLLSLSLSRYLFPVSFVLVSRSHSPFRHMLFNIST